MYHLLPKKNPDRFLAKKKYSYSKISCLMCFGVGGSDNKWHFHPYPTKSHGLKTNQYTPPTFLPARHRPDVYTRHAVESNALGVGRKRHSSKTILRQNRSKATNNKPLGGKGWLPHF